VGPGFALTVEDNTLHSIHVTGILSVMLSVHDTVVWEATIRVVAKLSFTNRLFHLSRFGGAES
jgi:hypothetical protein